MRKLRTEKEIRLKRLELVRARGILFQVIKKDLSESKESEPEPVKWVRHYLNAAFEAFNFVLGESSGQIMNIAISGCEEYLRKSTGGNIEHWRYYYEKRRKVRDKIFQEEEAKVGDQVQKDAEELLEMDWNEFQSQQ